MASSLAVVIVSYNAADVLVRTIESARRAVEGLAAEIIVVDNDSPDKSADVIAATFPDVRLFRRPNLGFAAGVNHGVAATAADTVLLLNPDCFVDADALARCLETLRSSPSIAAVSCRMVDEAGEPMLSARPFPTLATYFAERFRGAEPDPAIASPPRPVDIDSATGAFVLLTREAWNDIGPFDDGFFLYFEETEWFWRARRAGWRVVHEPRATVVHLGAQSTRKGVGGSPVVRANGMLLRAALDSRERYWRRCYGAGSTLVMRGATLALALVSMAMLVPGIALGRGSARARLPVETLRARHALHLAGPPLHPGKNKPT
jgi:N-acetylglucosaminyl-diphospho-decaprenol L-rhamnosyltransferase